MRFYRKKKASSGMDLNRAMCVNAILNGVLIKGELE